LGVGEPRGARAERRVPRLLGFELRPEGFPLHLMRGPLRVRLLHQPAAVDLEAPPVAVLVVEDRQLWDPRTRSARSAGERSVCVHGAARLAALSSYAAGVGLLKQMGLIWGAGPGRSDLGGGAACRPASASPRST